MRYQFLQLSNITPSTFDVIRRKMNDAKDVKIGIYKISSASSYLIEGVFVKEKIRILTVTKEDGSTEDIKAVSFDRKSFKIDLKNKLLVVWNYGHSAQPLVKSISSLSEYQLAIESAHLNIQLVKDWLYKVCSSVVIQKTITLPLLIPKGGLVRFEVAHQQNKNAIQIIEGNLNLGKVKITKQIYKCIFQEKPLTFSVLKKGTILIDHESLIEESLLLGHPFFVTMKSPI